MPNPMTFSLRFLAAGLLTGSGLAHIASLWFRELDQGAVGAMLLGAVYLIIAIGLFGQSRFTLFLSIAVPAAVALGTLQQTAQPGSLQAINLAVNAAIICLSAIVLWQVRNRPSL
jgi:hypothetical protein